MSNKDVWNVILVGLAVGGFIWALNERKKSQELALLLRKNEAQRLKLMTNYLAPKKEIPQEIKTQLLELREKYIGIDDAVAIELKTIVELIEDNKEEIAIEKLTKIIEHLLKEKYSEEKLVPDNSRFPNLFTMLKEALQRNWINQHEFSFSCLLKEQRNTEAHELAVKFPQNWQYISFLAGIELVYKLKGYLQR